MKFTIPDKIFGRKVDGALEKLLSEKKSAPTQKPKCVTAPDLQGFVYVPSIGLYVSRGRQFQNKNWYQAHEALHKQGDRMLTIREFVDVLKYTKSNNPDVYEDITAVREPWRSEWLDADFKVVNGILHINYNHRTRNGELKPQSSEPLVAYLDQNKTPGIDLEHWLTNHTNQGLPKPVTRTGSLYYWAPMSDNNSVARFGVGSDGAYLDCSGPPEYSDSSLRVRIVREAPH